MRRFDPTVRGIVLLALLVLLESIQLVIVLGLISRYIPFGTDPFNADLFPIYKSQLQPNHQMLIYHIFIVINILAQAAGVFIFRGKLADAEFQKDLKRLLCVDTLWVMIQVFAVFKILIYNGSSWAWSLLYISLTASVVSRIFWIEILQWTSKVSFSKASEERPFSLNKMAATSESLWVPLFVVVESVQAAIAFNFCFGQAGGSFLTYGVFILSIIVFLSLTVALKIRISQKRSFIIVESLITFLILSALFKMVIYDYRNQLAANAYHVLLVMAVLNKICWPAIRNAGRTLSAFLMARRNGPTLRILGDCFSAGLILAILYLPDLQGVLAKMFVGEQFHHITSFIMAPAWAYVSGCVLDVDVISRYGIGLPIVLSTLTRFLGGFNYVNMLSVIMWVCIIYYVMCYVFLRVWLKNVALALAAILMGIKVQMFYTLSVPQPLTYPSGTPVRFIFDIVFMLAIWGHLSKQRPVYLWLAALSCAGALFYMVETGLYLTTAFYGYLLMDGLMPGLQGKNSLKYRSGLLICGLSVPLCAMLLLGLAVGHHVLEGSFWYNNFEFTKYFTGGLGLGHFYGGLQYGQFWDLLIGFLFPIVYILTILTIGTLCVLGKISRKHLMVIVLCIYGLGTHHYYVAMATANNYYERGLPFIFVIFYWIRLGLTGLRREVQAAVGMGLVAFSAYALWTNHHFLSYPNMLNVSRNPLVDPLVAEELPGRRPYFFHKVWDYPEDQKLPLNSLGQKYEGLRRDFSSDEELKSYYAKENDYPQDAKLIGSLTSVGEPVALISSFETEILMQANRRPLFYYFRILYSRPMRMRNFPTDEILTRKQLQKLIDELKSSPSPYVFMERIFLNPHVPAQYQYDKPGLMGLLAYVNSHYRPYAYGKYLVALVRQSAPMGGE